VGGPEALPDGASPPAEVAGRIEGGFGTGTDVPSAPPAGQAEVAGALNAVDRRLARIETLLGELFRQRAVKDRYTTGEAAQPLGRAEFTVREWCRLGQVNASKRACGRGQEWAISHAELERIRNKGLLPQPTVSTCIR
jgi:hypothetical protein